MRVDLGSLSKGRACAQASHASNAFWNAYGKTEEAQEWAKSTTQGFGTSIVLGASLDVIKERCNKVYSEREFNGMSDTILDPDYVVSISSELLPYMNVSSALNARLEQSTTDPNKYMFHRAEITCAYIFGDRELLKPIVGDLPLYS